MNILFVSALLPYPLYQGGQVRMYNLLKKLASRHNITLLSFVRSVQEEAYVKKLNFCQKVITILRGNAWQPKYILNAFFGTKPFLYATYDNGQMRKAIADELLQKPYDVIHLEPGYVWPSLPKTSVSVVAVEHNIESAVYAGFVARNPWVYLRPILYWDVLKLRWWERHVWEKAGSIVAVSEADATVIGKRTTRVSVVPNGVDLDLFTFRPKKTIGKRLLFVGYFGWLQNRDALGYLLDDIWPQLMKRIPGATLRVVGKRLNLKMQDRIRAIGGSYDDEVADIVKEYHDADLLLAPIRIGGGTRYKILEAMATGLSVVTTTVGAQGLAVSHERELLVADSPDDLAAAVSEALANPKLRLAMTKYARRVIEQNYSWDRLAKKLEGVWNEAKKTG